jgi:hypothetical protein
MTESSANATNTASVLKIPEQKQAFLVYVNGLLKHLITQLNQGLVERDEAIKLTLLSVWLSVFSLKKAMRLIIIKQYLKHPIRLFRQSSKIPQH